MNIGSKSRYPASALSNFAPHPFVIYGVKCNSMEGFLQSLKCKYPRIQIEICKLVGLAAKYKGKKYKWWKDGIVYWNGRAIDRHGDEYQKLLDTAFTELYNQSQSFRKALKATGMSPLTHTIGKTNPKETILTQSEFCYRLKMLRDYGQIPA
jgi:hypothetical protein